MKIAIFPGKCNQKSDILFAYTLNCAILDIILKPVRQFIQHLSFNGILSQIFNSLWQDFISYDCTSMIEIPFAPTLLISFVKVLTLNKCELCVCKRIEFL